MSTVGTLYDETVKFGYGKLLSRSVANSSSAIVCSLPVEFDTFWIDLACLVPSVGAYLFARMSQNGGSTWIAANYAYGMLWGDADGTPAGGNQNITSIGGTSSQQLQLSYVVNAASTQYALSGEVMFTRGLGLQTFNSLTAYNESSSGSAWHRCCGTLWDSTSAITDIRFYYGSGLILKGSVTVYGLRKGT